MGLEGVGMGDGFGLGLGAAAVALIGRLGNRGLSMMNTYITRNYTAKLEITNSDIAYEWMLGHLASRRDFTAHYQIGTSFKKTQAGAIKKLDFNLQPTAGTHYLWEKKPGEWIPRPIKVERTRSQPTASNVPFETIILETFCSNKTEGRERMLEILETARAEAFAKMDTSMTTQIYGTNGQEWSLLSTQSKRPLSSIILDPMECERILKDLKSFVGNKAWYDGMGIPYRRGYLFYGTPGSGKTALITALAGELKYSIALINMADHMMDDSRFLHLLNKAPPDTIIVLEDIDCAFQDRAKLIEGDKRFAGMSGGVTHSGLLNAIDGVTNSDGRILVMTTNYIERLDSALIRPGRVDFAREFKNASDAQICGMFLRFFPDSPDTHAWNFLTGVRSHNADISMARLQAYMMSHRDPVKAMENTAKLASNTSSTAFDGSDPVAPPELELSHFLGKS